MQITVKGDWIDRVLCGSVGPGPSEVRTVRRSAGQPLRIRVDPGRHWFLQARDVGGGIRSRIIDLGCVVGRGERVLQPAPLRFRWTLVRFSGAWRSVQTFSDAAFVSKLPELSLLAAEELDEDGVARVLVATWGHTLFSLGSPAGTRVLETSPLPSVGVPLPIRLGPEAAVRILNSEGEPVVGAWMELAISAIGPYRLPQLLGRTDGTGVVIVPRDVLGETVAVSASDHSPWSGPCAAEIRIRSDSRRITRIELPSALRAEARQAFYVEVRYAKKPVVLAPRALSELHDNVLVCEMPERVIAWSLDGHSAEWLAASQQWRETAPRSLDLTVDSKPGVWAAWNGPVPLPLLWRGDRAECHQPELLPSLVPEAGKHVLPSPLAFSAIAHGAIDGALCQWRPTFGAPATKARLVHHPARFLELHFEGVKPGELIGVRCVCTFEASVESDQEPDGSGSRIVKQFSAVVERAGGIRIPVPESMRMRLHLNDPTFAAIRDVALECPDEGAIGVAEVGIVPSVVIAVHGAASVQVVSGRVAYGHRRSVAGTIVLAGLAPGKHRVSCDGKTFVVHAEKSGTAFELDARNGSVERIQKR